MALMLPINLAEKKDCELIKRIFDDILTILPILTFVF